MEDLESLTSRTRFLKMFHVKQTPTHKNPAPDRGAPLLSRPIALLVFLWGCGLDMPPCFLDVPASPEDRAWLYTTPEGVQVSRACLRARILWEAVGEPCMCPRGGDPGGRDSAKVKAGAMVVRECGVGSLKVAAGADL